MKKIFAALGLAVTLSAISMPSHATFGAHKMNFFCKYFAYKCQPAQQPVNPTTPVTPPTPAHEVPEIDAAGAALALALMGGLLSISRERRRKRQA